MEPDQGAPSSSYSRSRLSITADNGTPQQQRTSAGLYTSPSHDRSVDQTPTNMSSEHSVQYSSHDPTSTTTGTIEYDRKRKKLSPVAMRGSVPPPMDSTGSRNDGHAGPSSGGLGLGLGADDDSEEGSKRSKKQPVGVASLTSESGAICCQLGCALMEQAARHAGRASECLVCWTPIRQDRC